MALFLSVEPGDRIRIGDSTILFEQKSGRRIRMRIDSELDIEHQEGAGDKSQAPPAKSAPHEIESQEVAPMRLTRQIRTAPP